MLGRVRNMLEQYCGNVWKSTNAMRGAILKGLDHLIQDWFGVSRASLSRLLELSWGYVGAKVGPVGVFRKLAELSYKYIGNCPAIRM